MNNFVFAVEQLLTAATATAQMLYRQSLFSHLENESFCSKAASGVRSRLRRH